MSTDTLVQRGTLHKWAAVLATVGVTLWGSLAYYVKAEDFKVQAAVEARVILLEQQQRVDRTIAELVQKIDRRLIVIEANLLNAHNQYESELRDIRQSVNELQQVIKEH